MQGNSRWRRSDGRLMPQSLGKLKTFPLDGKFLWRHLEHLEEQLVCTGPPSLMWYRSRTVCRPSSQKTSKVIKSQSNFRLLPFEKTCERESHWLVRARRNRNNTSDFILFCCPLFLMNREREGERENKRERLSLESALD